MRRAVDFAAAERLEGSAGRVRRNNLRLGDDRLHQIMHGFGVLSILERKADKWPSVNADDVEAETVCRRSDLAADCRYPFSASSYGSYPGVVHMTLSGQHITGSTV